MLFESIASAVGLPGPNGGKPYPTTLAVVTQPDAAQPDAIPDAIPDGGPDTGVRRVVIAEDEALIRMDLAEMLAEEGYDVVGQAGDGRRAVELARELRPDLVILDVKMPVLDGIAAAETIAGERIAPVVMLTAFSQRDLVTRARDAGAMAYLVKPFQRGDLVPAIEMAVSRYGEITVLEREVSDLQESLATRKSVDRAKGVLQEQLRLSEPDAFRWIQKTAMDLRLSMKQVADGVVEHGVAGLAGGVEDSADPS
jgi:AmiR/NasT family two-component response regulator